MPNLFQLLLYYSFAAIIFGIFIVFVVILVQLVRKRYASVAPLFKRLPLADRSGAFTPPDAVLIFIKSKRFEDARRLLEKDRKNGAHPLHFTMEILLYSQWGYWSAAQSSLDTLIALTKTEDVPDEDKEAITSFQASITKQDAEAIAQHPFFVEYEYDFLDKMKRILIGVIATIVIIGAGVAWTMLD